MRHLFTFTFCLLLAAPAFANLRVLKLEELEGLLPSFWLDRTGFAVAGAPTLTEQEIDSQSNVAPLLPLYQKRGFGKNTYVGGVIETRYLQGKSVSDIQEMKNQIRRTRLPDGIPLIPYFYDGRLFGIRADYQVVYKNSTTVGLSLSFGGGGNQVVLGNSTVVGFKLDFGSPLRVNPEKGLNIAQKWQSMLDDWSGATGPDETQLIIDQAIGIAPVLLSHFVARPIQLVDENGTPLSSLPSQDLDRAPEPVSRNTIADSSGEHSREWEKVLRDLHKKIKNEIRWKSDVAKQVAAEKIFADQRANNLIQNLCDRLSETFDVPRDIWPRCRVSASLTPNAWAYPGGDIFITAGLLGILKDIDSVALVLGHEIGHVIGRHGSQQISGRKKFAYASTYVSAAVNIGVTGLALGGGWGLMGDVNFLSWFPQSMASSTVGGFVAKEALKLAFLAPAAGLMIQSRQHEAQSDRLGHEAAFTAGAEQEKMAQGWEDFTSFLDRYFQKKLNLKEWLLRDHPDNSSRLRGLAARASDLESRLGDQNKRNAISPEIREEYARLHKKLGPYIRAYGRELEKRLEDSSRTGKADKKLRHFMSTLVSPQSLCVRHALGGG